MTLIAKFQIKNSMEKDKYEKLKDIVSKYNNDGEYQAFRDELFELFNGPEFFVRLKGYIILFRKEHKLNFQKDCEQFIQSSQ